MEEIKEEKSKPEKSKTQKKPVVLVTGGGKGIGAEISRFFAREGYRVFINYHSSRERALALCDELTDAGFEAYPVRADISKEREAVELVEDIIKQCGRIDVLVNNAGVAQQKLFTDITEADWNFIFDTNIKGMFLVTREVLRHMVWEKGGRIINLSSMWGVCGASCEVHYSASKAAVIGLTKALAKEVGPSKITVNCVAPGVIDTDMNRRLSDETMAQLKEETPLGMIGSASDIAEIVMFLASDKGRFITGQVMGVNGGFVI